MKKLVTQIGIIFGILFPQFSVAEVITCKELAKFIITDATINGDDVSSQYIDEGAYLVFYTVEGINENIHMANFWPKSNSQSYGEIFGAEISTTEADSANYKMDYCSFNWSYKNTYDDKKGTAKVEVIKIFKPAGVAFVIKIIPEDLDVLIYKGYMEGTLDFSAFQ